MTAAVADVVLTDADLDRLEAATRADLHYAITGLETLRDAHAHTRRGYAEWHVYVWDLFGDLLAQLRIPRGARLALVESMDAVGMKQRAIADRLGVSLGTVNGDLAKLGRVLPIRPAVEPLPAPTGRVYEQAAEWLRRHPDGLTLVELAAVSGWTEGKASGALTDVCRRGLAVRTEQRRADQRVHLAADRA